MCLKLKKYFSDLPWFEYLQQKIDFSIDLEEVSILSDYDMLQQVWINLIDNAIKYSRENCKIDISVKRLNDKSVKVSISDNGIGIEVEILNKNKDQTYDDGEQKLKEYEDLLHIYKDKKLFYVKYKNLRRCL